MAHILAPEKGTWVFLLFVAFFGMIIAVNTVFITAALNTNSGIITDKPYEKGLEYDAMLDAAQKQPEVQHHASFENNMLSWTIRHTDGRAIDAEVTALLVRPVKDGHDFEITLKKQNADTYSAKTDLPLKGKWQAVLKAKWKKQQYQTRFSFIAE